MARWRGRGGDGEHMAPLAPVPARRDNTCSWRAASVALLCLLAASLIIVGVLHSSSATTRSTASSHHASSTEYSLRGLNEANDTDGGAITDGPIANVSEYLRSIGYDADAEDGGNVFTVPLQISFHPDDLDENPNMCLVDSFWYLNRVYIILTENANVTEVAAAFNTQRFSQLLGVTAEIQPDCDVMPARYGGGKYDTHRSTWVSCPADDSLHLNNTGTPLDALPPPPTSFNKTLPERWENGGESVKVCTITLSFRGGQDPLLPPQYDTSGFAHFRWWSNTHWCRDSRVVGFYFMQAIKPGTTCTDVYANYPA